MRRLGKVTYVMRQVVIVWKVSASHARRPERKLPMRVHIARKPEKREHTAKNRPMMMNGNMNREVK